MFSYCLEGQDIPAPWTCFHNSEVKWVERTGVFFNSNICTWAVGSECPGLNPGIFFTAVGKSLNLSINEDNNTCLRGITKSTSTPLVAQTVKASTYNAGDLGSIPGVGKIPWRGKWQPTPVLLPGESHGWRSLVGYSPGVRKESHTSERLDFHFSL